MPVGDQVQMPRPGDGNYRSGLVLKRSAKQAPVQIEAVADSPEKVTVDGYEA